MNKNEKRGVMAVRMQAEMGERVVMTDLAEEFSLPDYQPEMKRLLRVRATVMPPDRYIGAGQAECAGRIDYSILYTGNDGAMYCANQSGEYAFSAPFEIPPDFDGGEGILCAVECSPEQTTGRVMAPRKLSIKCKLRSRVRFYGTRVPTEGFADDGCMERLCGESEYAEVFEGKSNPMDLADEIICDEGEDTLRVISADGQVFVSDVSAGSGVANCRGEVAIKLLCCRDGEENNTPYAIYRKIPFTQSVPVDGMEVNCDAMARGICTDIRITVEEGRILCEVSAILSVKGMRRARVAYPRDIYSTKRATACEYRTVEISRPVKCTNGNFSVNAAMTLEEAGIRAGLTLVDLSGSATVSGVEAEKGKYRILGKCRFHAILSDGEDLSAQEFEVPFRFEMEGGQEKPSDTEVWAEIISCRARLDSERIAVDAELSLAMSLCAKGEISMLTGVTLGEEWRAKGAVSTVCYPDRRDTLWSVAKRYHCPLSEMTTRNRIATSPAADAADSLAGVRFLLV